MSLFLAASALLAADLPPPSADYERYIACYEGVARRDEWRAQPSARLARNESFAAAVVGACDAELEPYRDLVRARAVEALTRVDKERNAALVDTTAKFFLVRAVLADWPHVEARMTKSTIGTKTPDAED